MITSLSRILKYGFQNFIRNGWLSVATIAVMVLALLVFLSLAFFDVVSKTAITSLQDKIDISVYFKHDILEEQILGLSKDIELLDEVKSVEYISQDKALAIFKEEHKDEVIIPQALEELNANPLPASLNIKAKDPRSYSVIATKLEAEKYTALIDKVTYAQSKRAIDRLTSIVDTFQNIGLAMTLVLSLVAILITFNTIRLAIYSNREEMGIMRLVGAANKFINGPYLVTGILYGVIAAIVSMIIVAPLVSLASPYIAALIPEMSLKAYFSSNLFRFFGLELLLGALLGAASSAIAIRRYLKI